MGEESSVFNCHFEQGQHAGQAGQRIERAWQLGRWAVGQQNVEQVKICELTDGRKQISHSMHMSALEHIKQDVDFRVSSSV